MRSKLTLVEPLQDAASAYYAEHRAEPGVAVVLGCGMLSSSIVMAATYPIALVRTRLQTSGMPGVRCGSPLRSLRWTGWAHTEAAFNVIFAGTTYACDGGAMLTERGRRVQSPSYSGVGECVRAVVNAEGVRGLYRGIVPCAMKVLPATSLKNYAVFDALTQQQRLGQAERRGISGAYHDL